MLCYRCIRRFHCGFCRGTSRFRRECGARPARRQRHECLWRAGCAKGGPVRCPAHRGCCARAHHASRKGKDPGRHPTSRCAKGLRAEKNFPRFGVAVLAETLQKQAGVRGIFSCICPESVGPLLFIVPALFPLFICLVPLDLPRSGRSTRIANIATTVQPILPLLAAAPSRKRGWGDVPHPRLPRSADGRRLRVNAGRYSIHNVKQPAPAGRVCSGRRPAALFGASRTPTLIDVNCQVWRRTGWPVQRRPRAVRSRRRKASSRRRLDFHRRSHSSSSRARPTISMPPTFATPKRRLEDLTDRASRTSTLMGNKRDN
jgi:hypothetical protein